MSFVFRSPPSLWISAAGALSPRLPRFTAIFRGRLKRRGADLFPCPRACRRYSCRSSAAAPFLRFGTPRGGEPIPGEA